MKTLLLSAFLALTFSSSSAILPRIILDSDRLDYATFPQAQKEKLNSGWDMEGSAFVRPFNRQSEGVVRYAATFLLPVGVTAELRFEDAKGGVLKAEKIAGGKEFPVCGAFEQDGALARVRLAPSKPIAPKGVFAKPFRVTVGWAVDEDFTYAGVKDGATRVRALPDGWRGEKAQVVDLPCAYCAWKDGKQGYDRAASDAVLEIAPGGWADPCARRSARGSDPAALLTKSFAFEFDALIGKDTRISFGDLDLNALYRYTPDVWYHFRFETKDGKTLVRLNGRVIVPDVKTSGFVIRNLSPSAKLLVDDVKAFALVSPADYPPAPVRVKGEEKWDVIMNICSLWYNGYHAGWRCVERGGGERPVLGYYDEGLPETADWEIKYLVDHGVDVQAFCWYPETHDGPIRHPRNEFHLRDGFKNARYSDRMKYCLIWEIQNAGRPHSLEAWKKNYVPYLIEHHFKDPRYYAPDGKPMLVVFGGWNFPDKTSYGSAAKAKEAFDYLEAELKKLGFKGLVTVSSNWHGGKEDLAACGFTARCAYNYGTEGWKVETQKTRNLARAAIPGAFVIPTVSVGFNSEPWHGKKYPMMSPADLKTSLAWVRDEFIPGRKYAEPWQAKAVWLSTWNEYGEGTYMMPCEDARGFGYLDAVREVFTDEKPDPKLNVKPTPAQRARICNLYPQTDVAGGERVGKYEATWKSIDSRPVPQWWKDAKFGIFIHWGPYAVPAYAPVPKDGKFNWDCYAEWYQGKMLAGKKDFLDHHAKVYHNAPYGNFAGEFRAEHFDAAAWAEIFRRAGAKYVVLTSKHHDGFALWPSPESPYYNALAMGPGRDLAGEFCAAMRAAGLRRGFYFSMLEYANPLYPGIRDGKPSPAALSIEEWNRRVNLPQLKELADRYEADIIWPDGEWDYPSDRHCSREYLAWLYNESKVRDAVVVNDRWGSDCRGHHGGHYTTEYVFEGGDASGDGAMHPWEECRGIGNSFGYNRFETPDHYMSREKCIETLVACVSRGGNLLLNVGPTADGRIPAIMQDRLFAIGDWLKVNGEAIYGSRRWAAAPKDFAQKRIYFTEKDGFVYAIVFATGLKEVRIPGFASAKGVSMLGTERRIDWTLTNGSLEIAIPAFAPGSAPVEVAPAFRIAVR